MITKRSHKRMAHVWSRDPALDTSDTARFEAGWTEFRKTGNLAALPLKEGQQPTVFEVMSLKRIHMLMLGDRVSADMASLMRAGAEGIAQLAFLRVCDQVVSYGVAEVRNLADADGRPTSITLVDDGRGGKMLSTETMEEIHYVSLINELGFRILELSMPSPTQGPG